MLREILKGNKAFLGKGANTRRLVAGDRFDDKDYPEMDKKKLDTFSEPVGEKKPAKSEKKGKGHMGQEPVNLSEVTKDDAKRTGPM